MASTRMHLPTACQEHLLSAGSIYPYVFQSTTRNAAVFVFVLSVTPTRSRPPPFIRRARSEKPAHDVSWSCLSVVQNEGSSFEYPVLYSFPAVFSSSCPAVVAPMAAARGCTSLISSVLRLRAHTRVYSLPLSRALGERFTTPIAGRYTCVRPFSSADDGAAAAAPPLSKCPPVHTVRAPSYVKVSHQQPKARRIGQSSAWFPSGGGVALLPFGGAFSCAGRSMTTLQPGSPISPVSAAPSSRKSPEVTAVEAAAPPDSPTLLGYSITSEQQLLARMTALKTQLLAANWQDYLSFVLNSAFWEAELHWLEVEVGPFEDRSSQVKELLRDLRRLFDLMAQASDVRDHINQILELGSRSTGLAGTGLNAADKVENFEDHVQAAVAEYDRLLRDYPEYCSLVDDCLGSGLAMMRQKQRFTFSALHRFFY